MSRIVDTSPQARGIEEPAGGAPLVGGEGAPAPAQARRDERLRRRGERPFSSQIASARLASAVAALAVAACSIGALAIGRLVIRRLLVGQVRIGRLAIDELDVGRLRVRQAVGPLGLAA